VNLRDALVRNTFWYGAVTVLGLVAGLIMSVVLARGLGPARMGDYTYLLWGWRMMMTLATLGFALATTRYTAEALARGNPQLARGFLAFFMRRQIQLAALVALALLPVVLALSPPALRWPFLAAILGLFPATIEGIYTHAIQGAQRYDITAQTSTLKMSLHLLAGVLAVAAGLDILGIFIGMALGTVITCLLQRWRALRLYPGPAVEVPPEARGEVRAFLMPLSAVMLLDALVWDRSEVFFLRLNAASTDIAFYSLAFGLATKAMILPEIFVGALLPTLSALHGRGSAAEFNRVYRTALRYVALAGAPIAVVGWTVAPGLITLLYGEPYLPAARIFEVLVAVAVLGAMRKVAWAALRAVGDRRAALHATWVAAMLNVGLAAALIPSLGTTGAIVANTAAQVIAGVWGFHAMARTHGSSFPAVDLGKIAAAAAAALIASWTVVQDSGDPLHLFAGAVIGFGTFMAACAVLRVLGSAEYAFLVTSTRRLVTARPTRA
jgi:O-antigen/teichoic acid export membrane protein